MSLRHPIVMGRPSVWVDGYKEGCRPECRHLLRFGFLLLQGVLTTPFRMLDTIRYSKRIRETPVEIKPIFIMGFWRSGTTFLHELLCQDPRFGRLTLYRALAPEFGTTFRALSHPVLSRCIPPYRPMDSVSLSIQSPQEEELALLSLTHANLYRQLFYPKKAEEILDRYGIGGSPSGSVNKSWMEAYDFLLRTLTWESGGKRLLLRNPANTARTEILRKMYPGAKFIHLYRNPVEVYASTVHLFKTLAPICALQSYTDRDLENYAISLYKKTMRRYLNNRSFIPQSDLLEISFEEFGQAPMEFVTEVYSRFGLKGLDRHREHMEKFVQSKVHYQKNEYSIGSEERKTIEREWGFAFDAFRYSKTMGP